MSEIMQSLFWLSFFLLFYVYIGYPLLIGLLALFKRPLKASDMSDHELPTVSLVIAAYNEEATIKRKIENVLNLDYPKDKIEIIIGSDGSDDNTNKIVETYVSDRLKFYPHKERHGKMAVVNHGVSVAKGEICVFTDVSEIFDDNAIRKLVRNFRDHTVGAVTGNHIYNPSTVALARGVDLYWLYQRWLQKMESRVATIMSCDGTIYACRRDLFHPPPVGTINDDKAVPWKIIERGKRIVFEPEAIARGDVLSDTSRFFRQKVRGQAGMYQLFSMFKTLFLPWHPLQWFIFISHAVGPVIAAWFVALLFCSNVLLVGQSPYNIFLLMQIAFYTGAGVEMLAQRFKAHIPVLHIPYIFVVSNVASICGFWAFLFKTQKATWKKVE